MPATTTTLSFTPLPPECGQTVVLTATVAPTPPDGETVQFIISADGPTLTGTLNGGQATATLSSPVCGQTVQLCAHVAASSPSPCLPTGQVTFAVSGGPTLLGNLDANGNVCVSTTGIAPGTHTVTVTYAGNGSVQGSSVNGSITVAKSNSSTLLISSPNLSTFGQNVTFTATVVAVAPGGGVPTGNVTFTISGGPTLMGTLNGVGQATVSTSALTAGPRTVTATYNGDGCFNPSTSAVLTQQVNPKATTLTAARAAIRMRTNGTFVIPTLSATLTETATSAAVVGQTITFSANSALGPLPLGSAVTDATGTATLTNVTVPSTVITAPTYTATFAGAPGFSGSTVSAALVFQPVPLLP